MIKAVIFDFFGVVCSDQYWQFVKADPNVKSEFQDLAKEVNIGQMSWRAFVDRVAEKTGQSQRAVHHMYESEKIDPRVVTYIRQLKEHYKIGLLTNAHHDFIDPLIDKAHLRDLFDAIVLSSRVGVTKPHPDIFKAILGQLGVSPDEAVFIDDIATNVDGAERAGINGILYETFEQTREEVDDLLGNS